jgi:glycosyltransferase involved in cell wall biosynthesis
MKTRVLHVVGGLDLGGTGTWLLDLTKRTDMSKYELSFCTFTADPGYCCKRIEENGGRIVACVAGRNRVRLYARLRAVIAAGQYDVVHSHIHLCSGLVMAAADRCRVPVRIAHSHTGMTEQKGSVIGSLYRAAMLSAIRRHSSRGLAVSEKAAVSLFGRRWKHDARWRIVHCGIDLTAFQTPDKAGTVQPVSEPSDSEITIGFLGRLAPVKNIRFFLRVAAEIAKRKPKATFLVIGDGPERELAKSEAEALGIAERTLFLGGRTDVPRLLAEFVDVLCMPSLYEGLPVALMESQASGVPAVVSDTITSEATAIPDLVRRCSLSESPSRWASAVLEANLRPKPSRQSALNAIRQTSFNICRSVDSIYQIYDEDLQAASMVSVAREGMALQPSR